MAVAHISGLKYKGFHPVDKKNVIRDINFLIDKFNEDDDALYAYMYDADNPNSFNKTAEDTIRKKLGSHRGYLLAYLHDMKFNATKLNDRLSYIREKEFQKFINSITTDPKKSIEEIRKKISEWYDNEKSFMNKEKEKLNIAFKESSKMGTRDAKRHIKEKQEGKRKKTIEKLKELINQVKEEYKNNDKAQKLITALETFVSILSNQTGNLAEYDLKPIISCFSGNRNWESIKLSEELLYPPLPLCDKSTNQIAINFYAMITDGGTKLINIVNDYIKKL